METSTSRESLNVDAHIQDSKLALRRQVREQLKALTEAQRAEASAKARALLAVQARWQNAQSILLFAPLPDEPDLWPLIAEALHAGKLVALPRFDPATKKYLVCQIRNPAEDLVSGQFGIREPNNYCPTLPLNRLDLILVPGVAFDLHGRRLGRGKGFYDQLLADVRGQTCGVAFDEQIVADIPMEPHDIPLNCILTPTRWIEP